MTTILAIDPGLAKCGAAVLAADGSVLERAIISTSSLSSGISQLLSTYCPARIIVGSGTGSAPIQSEILALAGDAPVLMVDESHTSELARSRYLSETPARGIYRLLPFLRTPDQPYDDYVAVILGERWLKTNPNFEQIPE
jgi:RNase H-fold protein (predicted Holliday junction resolvase)